MNIRIVTDSTCDLPGEIVQQFKIEVIPNVIVLDGKSYLDGIDMSREVFYDQLSGFDVNPTTATASTGTYFEIYNALFKQGAEYILSIHPPIGLSGIANAATSAAQHFGGKVSVIDSRQLSLGTGFQVLAAAQAAQQGKSLQEIQKLLTVMCLKTHVVAMLDTLKYVARSGRVSWAKARLASFLNLHALIKLYDAEILSLGEARTRKKGVERLATMLDELGPLQNLAILHTNAREDAEEFRNRFQHKVLQPVWVCNVTTVIGTHVGPNALGFAAVKLDPVPAPV